MRFIIQLKNYSVTFLETASSESIVVVSEIHISLTTTMTVSVSVSE
jgi:hypothetical protein